MTTHGCVLGDPVALEPWPIFSAYAAAKTAVVGFIENPAIETARDGLLANAVVPGAFASGITKAVRSSAESLSAMLRSSRAQKLLDAEKTVMKKAALLVANLTLARVKM